MAAAGGEQCLQVIEQGGAGGDRLCLPAQCEQGGAVQLRLQSGQQVVAVDAGEQFAFGGGIGIVQRQPQHEAVELGVGQREGAGQVQRVLRGHHEERLRQRMSLAVYGDLALGHRLQQRALRLRRGAVDLVGQQQAAEDRAGVEAELAGLALVHADPDDVRGQQVAGELHALELQREGSRQRVRKRGLAHAGHVLQQQMAAGDQAGKGELHLTRLAQQHAIDLGHRGIQSLLQRFVVGLGDGGHGRGFFAGKVGSGAV